MTVKEFIKQFDFENPDWSRLPKGFPNCDLGGLSSGEIGKLMAIQSMWEVNQSEKPQARSRVWKSTNGYIYLIAWSNASLLRLLVRKLTRTLPKPEYRLKAQLDDAARSVVANIEEGFARASTSEYLQFLGYSQGSLKEVKGDTQRCQQDGLIQSVPGSSLSMLGIDLKAWHEALKQSVISSKSLQDPLNSSKTKGGYRKLEEVKGKAFKFRYPPVDNLRATVLTYEVFIELVNKTDWHLRRLVDSLETKLSQENKFYQVEKARVK